MAVQKRFSRQFGETSAEVVVDVGPLRYTTVLFVDDAPVERKTGFRNRDPGELGVTPGSTNLVLAGGGVAADVHISPSSNVSVTWRGSPSEAKKNALLRLKH